MKGIEGWRDGRKRWKSAKVVSWYFEPSQSQRITPGLKTMFSLPPIYSARKSSNRKLSKKHKITPDTNLQKTYTNIENKIFEELAKGAKAGKVDRPEIKKGRKITKKKKKIKRRKKGTKAEKRGRKN